MLLNKIKAARVGLLLAAALGGTAGLVYRTQAAQPEHDGKREPAVSPADAPIRKPVAAYSATSADDRENFIFRADLSPDGKLVACDRNGGKLTVYAVGTKKPLLTTERAELRDSTFQPGAAFSPDGKLVAAPRRGKGIDILSTRTGKVQVSLALPRGGSEEIDALTFSPDGRQLAVSCGFLYHKDLFVFDTATGKKLGQPLENVDGLAHQLLFSADGRRLVANHWHAIYLVDAKTYRLIKKVPARVWTVFFQEGKLYATQASDEVPESALTVHEVTKAGVGKEPIDQLVEKIPLSKVPRTAIAGFPAVAAVVTPSNQVSVRNMKGRELCRVVGEDSPVRKLCLSADGRVLLIHRDSGRVEVFQLK